MSKKEQQRRIREQKRQAQARRDRIKRIATRVSLVIFLPLLLLAVLYGLLGQGEVHAPDEVVESDHVRGNPDGVTLVIYADFQCPACAREAQLVNQAWPRIRDDVRLVFRHYPLTDSFAHSWTAARYAEAAGRQDSFWEMHDMIFANQSYWSTLGDVTGVFDGYLRDLGLDVEQAREDMDDNAVIQKIRNDQRGGTRAGVRSTPSVFVNGRMTPPPGNIPDLLRAIDRATGEQG